jgi:3-methyladenine DNA glycosylase AlkD
MAKQAAGKRKTIQRASVAAVTEAAKTKAPAKSSKAGAAARAAKAVEPVRPRAAPRPAQAVKSTAPVKAIKKAPAVSEKAGKPRKPAIARLSLAEAMSALEAAGSEQTRRTYARHGVAIPMFGVSFATLKTLLKRIKVDHELALALWQSGNFDARNLAVKIVDPARMTPAELDRWALDPTARMCGSYVAHVAAEGPHAHGCVTRWLAAKDEHQRTIGWKLVGALAMRDESLADAWFAAHVASIERDIAKAPNAIREAMNQVLIQIGCRNPALREAASAAAMRIGPVDVDHGDTACKTPDAAASIDKAWDYAASKRAASPAAQERARESMRTRC